MKILGFGTDTSLLLPDDPANEGQYRQRRYCESLGQSKTFIIFGAGGRAPERVCAYPADCLWLDIQRDV